MTGISYEELFEIFEPFGLVEEIQLLPNRSYSFVVFEEIDSTVSAYEAVHGTYVLSQNPKQPHQDQASFYHANFIFSVRKALLINYCTQKYLSNRSVLMECSI